MRIKLKQWAAENEVPLILNAEGKVRIGESPALMEVLERGILDASCPALCSEGCEVEPDGRCAHGAPSLLLALGMI